MNCIERNIYDKYAYTEDFILKTYLEFERRVNGTEQEFEGLKPGECRFNYGAWEKRLNLTHKKMVRAINVLKSDGVITQIAKGVKGNSSIYFLARFEEQKKEQKVSRNKSSIHEVLEKVKEQKKEQNKIHTSKYNNLDIISNLDTKEEKLNIERVFNAYDIKHLEGKEQYEKKAIGMVLLTMSVDEVLRCVERYKEKVKGKDKQFIASCENFFKVHIEKYTDKNYIEPSKSAETKHIEKTIIILSAETRTGYKVKKDTLESLIMDQEMLSYVLENFESIESIQITDYSVNVIHKRVGFEVDVKEKSFDVGAIDLKEINNVAIEKKKETIYRTEWY